MQACVQCGLSIGEAATFCPVCGTRVGDGAAVATAVKSEAPLAATLDPEATATLEPEAADLETLAQPEPAPAAGLVSELDSEHGAGADPGSAHLDAVPVIGHSTILDAQPDAERAELVANLGAVRTDESDSGDDVAADAKDLVEEAAASEETPEEAAAPEEAPEEATAPEEAPEEAAAPEEAPEEAATPEESPDEIRERRMAEIAALLEFAGRCEDVNAARAAGVYGEVIVGCLEISEDPLGAEPVRKDLLRGFDRLSFVLERQGLPEEALAVVDDAASLGLLDGVNGSAAPQCGSLRERREGLRRILFGDSAQL